MSNKGVPVTTFLKASTVSTRSGAILMHTENWYSHQTLQYTTISYDYFTGLKGNKPTSLYLQMSQKCILTHVFIWLKFTLNPKTSPLVSVHQEPCVRAGGRPTKTNVSRVDGPSRSVCEDVRSSYTLCLSQMWLLSTQPPTLQIYIKVLVLLLSYNYYLFFLSVFGSLCWEEYNNVVHIFYILLNI